MTHTESLGKLDDTLERLRETRPDFVRMAAPRRYAVPHGYFSTKYYPVSLYSNALFTLLRPEDKVTTTGYIVHRKLLDYAVPTYYVQESLLNDLALTEPPRDLCLNEQFKWPMPAMTFMLPKAFTARYCGAEILSLSVARLEADEYLPTKFMTDAGPAEPVIVPGPHPRIGIYAEVLDRGGSIAAYGQSQPMTGQPLRELLSENLEFYGVLHESLFSTGSMTFDEETDKQITTKLISLVFKIMLVMVARPTLITSGDCQREASTKKGREREALWNPSFIGAAYASRLKKEHQGGTHSSPRLHWRIGHMRSQAYGEGRSDHKIIWIEPTIVGANDDEQKG